MLLQFFARVHACICQRILTCVFNPHQTSSPRPQLRSVASRRQCPALAASDEVTFAFQVAGPAEPSELLPDHNLRDKRRSAGKIDADEVAELVPRMQDIDMDFQLHEPSTLPEDRLLTTAMACPGLASRQTLDCRQLAASQLHRPAAPHKKCTRSSAPAWLSQQPAWPTPAYESADALCAMSRWTPC